jgi:hypothetical protein
MVSFCSSMVDLADGGRFERTQNPFCHFSDTTKNKIAADK